METLVIFSLCYAYFIVIDLIPIKKEEQSKLFWLYAITIGIASAISLALALEVDLPSPAAYIEVLVKAVTGQ